MMKKVPGGFSHGDPKFNFSNTFTSTGPFYKGYNFVPHFLQ